jgi:hypothetical protein
MRDPGSGPDPARAWPAFVLNYRICPSFPKSLEGPFALELHRELGLKVWHPFVTDVGSIGEADEDCDPPDDQSRLRDWLTVRNIRRKLILGA